MSGFFVDWDLQEVLSKPFKVTEELDEEAECRDYRRRQPLAPNFMPKEQDPKILGLIQRARDSMTELERRETRHKADKRKETEMHFKELTLVLTAKSGDHYAKVGGTIELAAGDSLELAKSTLFSEIQQNLGQLFGVANGSTTVSPAPKSPKAKLAPAPEPEAEVDETPPPAPPKPPKKGAGEEKKPSATAGKAPKSNVIIFNREIEEHRKQLGPILKTELGANYKQDPDLKPKGPYVSQKLTEEKAAFLDAEGNILDSFTQRVSDLLTQYDEEAAGDEP